MVNVLLVSFDPDSNLLLVGKKKPNEMVDILNAFEGEKAVDIYNLLVTQKKEDKKEDKKDDSKNM